jgi:hypothetical protein
MEVIYDQRSSKRIPYITKILILLNSGDNIEASTFNVSENGVGMVSNLDIPVGTNIKAQIYFDKEVREVEGRIKWSSKNPEDDTFNYGIQLSKFTLHMSK